MQGLPADLDLKNRLSIVTTRHKVYNCLFLCSPGEDLLQAVSDVLDDLQGLPVYVQGLTPDQVPTGMQNFDELMMRALPVRPDRSVREGMTNDSIFSYIYTSGTSGKRSRLLEIPSNANVG